MSTQEKEPALVAIRAGAGAGKTYRITTRYINHVLRDGLSPLQIVAVTFTDAAALELRSRIRSRLAQTLDRDDDRLAELEAARISTFHSLAAAICRQHPLEAGVPADFNILDEIQGKLWVSDRLEDALDTLPESIFARIPFTQMRVLIRELMGDPITAERSLYADGSKLDALVGELKTRAMSDFVSSEAWKCAVELLPRCVASNPTDKLIEHVISAKNAIQAIQAGNDIVGAFAAISSIKLNVGSAKAWNVDLSEIKDSLRNLRSLITDSPETAIITVARGQDDAADELQVADLRAAYEHVQTSIRAAKKLERVLDYNDLEVHALRALESADVRKYYHARWHAFVVDEYQDTNGVQDEILKRLRHNGARRAIVGDANQSIYGFRRADPGLIDQAAYEIQTSGGVLEVLDTNWRTHDALVAEMNLVFEHLFTAKRQPFVPQQSKRRPPLPEAEMQWIQAYDIQPEADDKAVREISTLAEAMAIAQKLAEMKAAGALVHDRETGETRPMRWGDVCIIARAWTSLDPYAEVFGSMGIPAVHMGGGNLLDTHEAMDGAMLLRFLADPADDLALAATLKSPFFSLSDADLFRIGYKRQSSLWKALRARREEYPSPVATLRDLLEARKDATPTRLLRMADNRCGLTAILSNLPNGSRRAADWTGFCDLVRDIEKTSFDAFSVSRVLRRLDLARKSRSMRIEAPRPPLEAGDAISLMSVHRSKGLEWPIVVMADLSKRAKSDDSPIYFDAVYGVGIKPQKSKDQAKPYTFTVLSYLRGRRDREEDTRLTYVAATRARDYLFLANSGTEKRSAYAELAPALDAAGIVPETLSYNPTEMVPPSPAKTDQEIAKPEVYTEAVTAQAWRIPTTALSAYMRCPRLFHYQFVEGHPGVGEGDDLPARKGTLVHKAIQLDIKEARVLQRFDRSLDPKAVQEALDEAMAFAGSPEFEAYREAEHVFEAPILYGMHGITLTGRIDMLGPDFILDFKTGQRTKEREYLIQLWVYGMATGRNKLVICYFDGKPPTERYVDQMQDEPKMVSDILTNIQRGEYTATPAFEKCTTCRYRSICRDALTAPR